MHLYKTMKNFLFDQDYFIDLWGQNIHVYGFTDILTLNDTIISLQLEQFRLDIHGQDFRVLKLTKKEILISGTLTEMKVIS